MSSLFMQGLPKLWVSKSFTDTDDTGNYQEAGSEKVFILRSSNLQTHDFGFQ
jgi:hypothetical protein